LTLPFLSIVIPAYNEETRLPHTLGRLLGFLSAQSYDFEILIVENGSTDRTLEIAQEFARREARIRVFHEDQAGKGRAVRRGMLEARGQYRFLCDADLSMPETEIPLFLPPHRDCDIAIASREAPGAVRYGEPFHRHLSGRIFNLFIRLLLLPDIQDTQCGFKCFRAAIAEDVFRHQRLMGWSFDVEVLYIARRRGYQICEVPVHWYFNPESKIRLLRDAMRMFADIWRIRYQAWKGFYDAPHAGV
jgi:glycosyltransferase involved in cell wall biosynthesis